jgi:2-phosphoglycerate kinase
MNPADLVTPQLINLCSRNNTIVICGFTKTGKITIAEKLAKELNRKLFISDNYQFVKPDESLYVFMDDIMKEYKNGTPMIVEGILCFRLLRKGIQLNNFFPDLILKTKCSENTIRHFYKKDGEESKINRALSFNKGLDKIWKDYLDLLYTNPQVKRPGYVELNTSLPNL